MTPDEARKWAEGEAGKCLDSRFRRYSPPTVEDLAKFLLRAHAAGMRDAAEVVWRAAIQQGCGWKVRRQIVEAVKIEAKALEDAAK